MISGAGGAVIGFLGHLGLRSYLPGVDTLDCVIFSIVAVGHRFNHFNSSEHLLVNTYINPCDPHTSFHRILIQLVHFLGG